MLGHACSHASEAAEVALRFPRRGGHVGAVNGGDSARRIAGATRHNEPNEGYQCEEELVWMLGRTKLAAGGGEMAGGNDG